MMRNYAVAPGEYLQEWLEDEGVTQTEFAEKVGFSRKKVNEIVLGKTVITGDTAIKLERVTQIPVDSWLRFESQYQSERARLRSLEELSEAVDCVSPAAGKYLRKNGYISATKRTPGKLVDEFLQFLGLGTVHVYLGMIDSLFEGESALATLKEQKSSLDESSIMVWKRAAELQDIVIKAGRCEYSEKELRALLPALKQITKEPHSRMLDQCAVALAEVGVSLVYLEAPERLPLYGMTWWRDGDKPIIQLSGRRKNDANNTWTLFHEIGHVLNDPRGHMHLDFNMGKARNSQAEKQANAFARKCLFAGAEKNFGRLRTENEIIAAAEECGVAPGLVLFHMRRAKQIEYSRFTRLITTFSV